jgi:Caspase domain
MRYRFNVSLSCVFSLLVSTLTLGQSQPAPPNQSFPASPAQTAARSQPDPLGQPRFALLVGINKYQDTSIPPLTGSENDVTLLKETLTKDYGFDENSILTLRSEQATRDAMLGAFRTQLIENAKKSKEQGKDALIVFYYSGHGSRVPDQDDDETGDDWDETLVPYDSRTAKGFDIRDDEIDDLFAELSQYSSNVTLIFDSCHSGTVSRGELEARESPSDTRAQPPYKRRFPPTGEDRVQKYVTISASLPSQRAYTRPKELAPVRNGALTYHLVAALRRASRQTTYRALMNEVAAAVSNEIRIQDPQVEGDKDRLIFGGATTRAEPYVEITDVNDNQVTLKAGKVHGVQVGTYVAIYSPEATSYVGKEKWLTNATVTEVRDFVAVARMPTAAESPQVKEVTRKAKVILAAPTFGGGPLPVSLIDPSLSGSSAQTLSAEIRRQLEEKQLFSNQLVQLVDEAKATSSANVLRLKRGTFKDIFRDSKEVVPAAACTDNADALPAGNTEGYYLDEGTGVPLFGLFVRSDDQQAGSKITNAIANRTRQINLLNLENKVSSLNDAVSATLMRVPGTLTYECEGGLRKPKFKAAGEPRPADNNELPLGTVYHLKIRITSAEDLYITAVLLGNDGGIKVIFPKVGENDKVAGGNTVTTRSLGTVPPSGKEVVKIIVTRRYTDFSFLEAPAVRRSGGSPLERLLNQSGFRTREGGLPPDAPDQWGVVSFDLIVTDENSRSSSVVRTTSTRQRQG